MLIAGVVTGLAFLALLLLAGPRPVGPGMAPPLSLVWDIITSAAAVTVLGTVFTIPASGGVVWWVVPLHIAAAAVGVGGGYLALRWLRRRDQEQFMPVEDAVIPADEGLTGGQYGGLALVLSVALTVTFMAAAVAVFGYPLALAAVLYVVEVTVVLVGVPTFFATVGG
jgi:hypothetical protein